MHYTIPRLLAPRLFSTAVLCGVALPASAFAEERSAEQWMVVAHEARATWDEFPGLHADLMVSIDGQRIAGEMSVTAEGQTSIVMDQSPIPDWVQRRVESLVRHRMPPPAERQFDVQFADQDARHPLGRLIRFNHDPWQSVYRIDKDVITEVHRTMGESRFTITTLQNHHNSEGKQLPHVYTVSWWDAASGNLRSCEVVTNEWIRIGRWDLPARLLVIHTAEDGKREVREVIFRNHRLSGEQ